MYIYIYPVLGDGPHWKEKVAGYQPFCKKFWWTNIAYINNLYPCQLFQHESDEGWNSWGDGPNPGKTTPLPCVSELMSRLRHCRCVVSPLPSWPRRCVSLYLHCVCS